MNRKLGLLAGVITLASALVPLAASPGGAANYSNGSWYCFGKKATKTVPDVPGHWQTWSDGTRHFYGPTFYGTGQRDVIVGTESGDDMWGVSAGDVVCSRGGSDMILANPDVNPTTGWNRVKVDAGYGNDDIEVDYDLHDWGNPAARWVTFEAHGGPGDDVIWGGEGNDLLFADTGTNFVYCGGGEGDVMYGSANMPQADCEKFPSYGGYGKGFTEFRQASTTVTTTRSTASSPTPVTTSPAPQPPVTTTTR